MLRKRKILSNEFDNESGKDEDEKKLCTEKDFTYCRLNGITDFDVFHSFESVIADNSGCTMEKGDAVNNSNVDDFNINNNNNDSLFMNSCNYDYMLPDNDILNSVTENTNFYNEPITLFNNNTENEILFDNSFEQDCLESAVTNPPLIFPNNEILSNDVTAEIVSMVDSLENIVPNLCMNSNLNSIINQNFINESGTIEKQFDFSKTSDVAKVISEEPETNIYSSNGIVNSATQESGFLNEFLHFNETQTNYFKIHGSKCISNSNGINDSKNNNNINDNHAVIKDEFKNISGSENVIKNMKIIPFQHIKDIKILEKFSTKIEPDLENITLEKTNINDVNNIKFNSEQTRLSSADVERIINSIKIKKVPFVKFEDFTRNQKTIKLAATNLEKCKIIKLCDGSVDKCVQTVKKYVFKPDVCKVNESEKVNKNRNLLDNNSIFVDRIKKPELYDNSLLFSFAVNVRSSLYSVLTQEDFINNNEKISYYTGIPQYSYFMALLNMLHLPSNNTISPFQMLLLTLMKIRLNLEWSDLAYRFGRSVQVAQDAFGITVYILTRCLANLVSWPLPKIGANEYLCRAGRNFYVFSVNLLHEYNNISDSNNRIFICLSDAGYPIHFVSKPFLDECSTRLTVLRSTGIIDGLVQNDVVIFDKNINFSSKKEDKSTVLSVLTKSCNSFCVQPYNETIEKDVKRIEKTVSEIRKYKFLFEKVSCEWVKTPVDKYQLFTDVVKVVCGLINLCDILPFSNSTIKKITSERKNIKLRLT